ncbi:hypothetical protein [Cohnella zeiphila]
MMIDYLTGVTGIAKTKSINSVFTSCPQLPCLIDRNVKQIGYFFQ